MNLPVEMQTLAEFRQDTEQHIYNLKESGDPVLLTVDGKPAVVVQDVRAYDHLLQALEKAEAYSGIRKGLSSMAKGEGQSAKTFFGELRQKHQIP